MTRQTLAPIQHTSLAPSARPASTLVRSVDDGQLDLDPPYQRGAVWTVDQHIALVRSWLTGLPAGVVILSDRGNPAWAAATEDVYETGAAIWAAVDGKQRILTAKGWFDSQFAVPSSWFDPALVAETEATSDGPYVRHCGLTEAGQLKFDRRAQFQVAEFRTAASIADEAAAFVLVNGGGTPQSRDDMNRARSAAGVPEEESDSTADEIQDCTCIEFCDQDPATACTLSGRRHVHPRDKNGEFGPCPVHPEAEGDL
ncbi:DUF262 domain-containing protein [Streptomyces sp. RKAG337]|uniref:DUF262 domain-containing protein n=1 Tax=Streptomyces sp. RKAG337 TaxID=2893404 RepID=UPI00203325CB|nr:DUF262 domain-containing protein [Streptomyces sp. RKAG337]MCM2430947.1 DUF262 domain-containing protein [Streptomyces sp. RKAG337]